MSRDDSNDKATWNKVIMATYGVVLAAILAWSAWVTSCIYTFEAWKNVGPRFTTSDAALMRANILEDIRHESLAEAQRTRAEIEVIRKDIQALIVEMRLHFAAEIKSQP